MCVSCLEYGWYNNSVELVRYKLVLNHYVFNFIFLDLFLMTDYQFTMKTHFHKIRIVLEQRKHNFYLWPYENLSCLGRPCVSWEVYVNYINAYTNVKVCPKLLACCLIHDQPSLFQLLPKKRKIPFFNPQVNALRGPKLLILCKREQYSSESSHYSFLNPNMPDTLI